jgi:Fic family protein
MSFNPTYPFDLPDLPPKNINYSAFSEQLLKARVELAELRGTLGQIPNPLLLTSPAIIRESVASSNIENINTTLVNVLHGQLIPDTDRSGPDKEVLKYSDALYWGFKNIGKYSLSSRTILGIQKKLLPKGSGRYRIEQNQIKNTISGEIKYTPPKSTDITRLINNWENYTNQKQPIDPLIKAIISHYQFESIHPFVDGNGRTGRILMVLQLVKDGLLDIPVLFISGFINKNRSDYYKYLNAVSSDNKWSDFINFMLSGFYQQAIETKRDIRNITSLRYEFKQKIRIEHRKIYSADLVDSLFVYPIITPSKLAKEMDIHYTTASRHLFELSKSGLLKEAKVGKYHFFGNTRLVNLLSK